MNEDALIAMVIETKQRVDFIEANMFTKADQNRMFGLLDTLVKGYNDLRDEVFYHSLLLRGLRDDVDILKQDVAILKKDMEILKKEVSILKEDVAVLKKDVQSLKIDMVRVKNVLELR